MPSSLAPGLKRHAALDHLSSLAKLDNGAYAAALRRPRHTNFASSVSSSSSSAVAASQLALSIGGPGGSGGGLGARNGAQEAELAYGVLRKLERQFATARGVPVVFGDE